MLFIMIIFLNLWHSNNKKKGLQALQLVITVLLNAHCYKHLALYHLMAPARNVGTINKLYYSTLTFHMSF